MADDPTDPLHMTEDQRREELCLLLASAVQRLLDLGLLPCTPDAPESAPDGLDVHAKTSVHVPRG
jgi:hypothetical protein